MALHFNQRLSNKYLACKVIVSLFLFIFFIYWLHTQLHIWVGWGVIPKMTRGSNPPPWTKVKPLDQNIYSDCKGLRFLKLLSHQFLCTAAVLLTSTFVGIKFCGWEKSIFDYHQSKMGRTSQQAKKKENTVSFV